MSPRTADSATSWGSTPFDLSGRADNAEPQRGVGAHEGDVLVVDEGLRREQNDRALAAACRLQRHELAEATEGHLGSAHLTSWLDGGAGPRPHDRPSNKTVGAG
jgi:hypothetical protein